MSKGFTYTLKIDAEIQNLLNKTDQAKKSMQNLLDSGKAPGAEKMFNNIYQAIDNLQKRAAVPINSETTFGSLLKDTANVGLQLDKLNGILQTVRDKANSEKLELLPPDVRQQVEGVSEALNKFSKAQEEASRGSQELIETEKQLADAQNKLKKAQDTQSDASKKVKFQKEEVQAAREGLETTKKQIDALKQYQKTMEAYQAAGADKRSKLSTPGGELSLSSDRNAVKGSGAEVPANVAQAEAQITKLTEQYNQQALALKNAESAQTRYNTTLTNAVTNTKVAESNVQELTVKAQNLRQAFQADSINNTNLAFQTLRNEAAALGVDLTNIPVEFTEQGFESLTQRLIALQNEGLNQVNQACDQVEGQLTEVRTATEQTTNAVNTNAQAFQRENESASQVSGLVSRIKYFVGLQGAVILARRALREAFQTIKELDAAMTEMAVVTDLEIGDYWKMLPEFTANANALGVSIQGAYEATTLYLQQGLKMAEAQELSNQTLKMARIAGLEASDATDKMTAALRGFNMELNEASAQKVADVYSQLAAITAADVEEISSAMTKTASIASSAGMEFETTAAFLSQIIETTRESAETAGTALKTVIARFQELKKAPSEIGEVDGEIIDANKIETALRSVGVSLRDANGQFRELDDVFLELSSKWDSLDTNTQRYIATIAAGSRQQSRFIAMMQDYNRTQELVDAANTSAGASNKQFEKTLESLESKLAKLSNSWNTFTMSLMNNEFLKGAIDLLVAIMDGVNNFVAAMDKIGLGSAASIGLVVLALVAGTKALNAFEIALRATNEQGKRVNTTLGAIGVVGKQAAMAPINSFKKLSMAIRNTKMQQQNLITIQAGVVGSSLNLKIAQDKVALAERNLAKAQEVRGASSNSVTIATKRLAQAQQELAFQEGAYKAIQTEKIALQGLGLSATEAETLALQGHTAQEFQDALAKEMSTGLSKKEALQRTLTTFGIQEESNALNVNNLIRNSAILSFLQDLGLRILHKKATDANTKSEIANVGAKITSTGATEGQAAANMTLLATMWPILVATLAIMAAVVLLVGVIYLFVKAVKKWKANSPEGRLAAIAEAAEKAKEVMEETKEVYEELLSASEEYADLADQVETLTEGTTAWKEAVSELNEKVLELLTIYPQLIEYLTISENGAMNISDEGWQHIINQQQEKVAVTQGEYYKQQLEDAKEQYSQQKFGTYERFLIHYYDEEGNRKESSAEYENGGAVRYYEAREERVDFVSGYEVLGEDNQAALVALSQLTWGTEEYNEKMMELRRTIGLADQQQVDALNTFDATAQSLASLANKAELYKKQVLFSLGSESAKTDANYTRIINSLVESYDDIYKDVKENAEDKWKKNNGMWNNGSKKTTDAMLEEMRKYGVEDTKNEKLNMARLLAAKGGHEYTDEEVKDMKAQGDNILAAELQAIDATSQIRENYVEKLYELQEENSSFGELYSGSLDIDLGSISKQIEGLEDLEEYSYILIDALENRVETVQEARKNIDLELKKIYSGKNIKASDFSGSYDQAKKFVDTYNEILSGVGKAAAINFADMFEDFGISEQEKFFENYGNINWSSSIQGAAALREMLQSSSIAVQEFALKTLALEDSMYSATAQMNEFYNSLNAEALEELAKDGKITALEMAEMAKTNSTLATMMENTGASAAELANYYELLEKGTIKASEATENFTKALGDLHAASNTIENSFAFIDTFEPARSQTEISEYFSSMRESAMELYDIGAYGDQQLKDYIEQFLGKDNWQKIIAKNQNNMKAAIDDAMKQINSYGENFYGTWKALAEQGLKGVTVGETGAIQFDVAQIGNLDSFKQQIIDMGWSEIYADALIADAQTFSADLEKELDKLGVAQMFETWLSGAINFDGKTIIPKEQVKAMADQLDVDFSKLKDDLEKQGISVGEWVTEEGEAGEDFAALRKDLIQNAMDAQEFDLDTNYQLLLDLGLNDAAAKEELKTMANSLKDVPLKINGETLTQAGDVLYNTSGAAIEGATTDGLIDGLEDPKTKAAQDLSALEQGKVIGQATATGTIIAASTSLQIITKKADEIINGLIEKANLLPFVEIDKVSLTDKVASLGSEALANAESAIAEKYDAKIDEQKKILNTPSGENTKAKAQAAAIASNYSGSLKEVVEGYSSGAAQTAGLPEEVKLWENAYDTLYNLNQELNVLTKQRERLERKYSRTLEDNTKSAQELANITANQLNSLREEAKIQNQIAQEAIKNVRTKQQENNQYAGLYKFDETTGKITIDWEAVEAKNWTEDEGSDFEEFISYLEEQGETYQESLDALYDIEDEVSEIEKRGRSATSDIYNQVKEGLIKERQEQIDQLQTINDSIQDAQSALIDQMQKQIDEARQARENEKTEQDISDKEARLAYLMSDTSGGNAEEIASLQKEIAEDKEGYADTLVDQQLQSLQDANELAAEQRQQQIDLAQAQLDAYVNSGAIWAEVQQKVNEGFAAVANGVSFSETTAGQLAQFSEDIATMNPFEKEDFIMALDSSAKEGAIWSGFVSVTGSETTGEDTTISGLNSEISGGFEASTAQDAASQEEWKQQEEARKEYLDSVVERIIEQMQKMSAEKQDQAQKQKALMEEILLTIRAMKTKVEVHNNITIKNDTVDTDDGSDLRRVHPRAVAGGSRISAVTVSAFKSGGLADYTGPAWLDGTKSKPEIVLNQRDSANFIQLRDILSEVMDSSKNGAVTSQKTGDNYFDIEINVDSLENDYDVEQLADKIRSMLYEDATQRNVNAIHSIR